LLPPDLLPEPAGSQANIGKVINQPTIDDLPLPKIGSAFAGTFLGPRQGGDYDGEESLTPDLPELKPVPMPVAPAEDIDPGFHTPIPPEEIDPGLIHPAPEPRRAVTVEREPVFA
jgi:extensin